MPTADSPLDIAIRRRCSALAQVERERVYKHLHAFVESSRAAGAAPAKILADLPLYTPPRGPSAGLEKC